MIRRTLSVMVASDKSAPKETPNKDVIEQIYVVINLHI